MTTTHESKVMFDFFQSANKTYDQATFCVEARRLGFKVRSTSLGVYTDYLSDEQVQQLTAVAVANHGRRYKTVAMRESA